MALVVEDLRHTLKAFSAFVLSTNTDALFFMIQRLLHPQMNTSLLVLVVLLIVVFQLLFDFFDAGLEFI